MGFDDAINNNNIDLYREIFNKQRKNPNGCDVKASFFVSHKYTNYSSVQEMHYMGHEIAAHSITHNDEELPGCAMVDSCSNILSGDQFYNFLTHNFYRHYDQNRAPLGLFFHAAWLKNNPEFLDAFLYWVDEILSNHNDVYFVTMTQVIQWIQNPKNVEEARTFEPWKEKCAIEPRPACISPNRCKLSPQELPGEAH